MANVPYQPQGLAAEQADGSICLTWQASLGATSYQIQRSTDGVNYANYATAGVVTQFIDQTALVAQQLVPPLAGVQVGTMYFYQVAGVSFLGAYAAATVTFSGQPTAGDTISIANMVLTAGTSFSIGGTPATTAANLATAVNADPALTGIVTAAASGAVTTISAAFPGTEGNGLQFSNALTNTTATPFSNGIAPVIGPYSIPAQMVPAPPSEMSLYELRLRAQQTADRVNSNFVSTPEWNSFLRLAQYELYDLLITSYEDLFASSVAYIQTNGNTFNYPLPDGVTDYLGGTYGGTSGTPAPAFYKLAGMDLAVNTSTISPAWVTLLKFDFIQRNAFVYPNSTSTIYGIYNMRYRLMGNFINIIPTPAGNQTLRMWYSPKLKALLADTDVTTLGYSGWLRYTIVRAAKYALDKEEGSDTSKLDAELLFLKTRIEQTSQNRDAGVPDTISATRRDPVYGGGGDGMSGGGQAGW